jgi:hypothetical protein
MSLTGQRLQRKQAASAGLTARTGGAICSLLAERVPFPASLALALPAAESGAAVLAYEGRIALRHRESPGNSV